MWITVPIMWITRQKNVDNLTQNCGKVRKKSITINGKKPLFSIPSLQDKQKSISVDMLWFR